MALRYGVVLANWTVGDDVAQLVDVAVEAEEAGWDGVFLADHLIFPPPSTIGAASTGSFAAMPDPWITIAGIATRTSTITLGSWITPIPRRQPWQVARDIATLDRLSGGRVLLGVGLGRRPDYEMFGAPWDLPTLGRQCDEALELIDRFWTGEPVHFDGDYYTVRGAGLLPTPLQQPRVPIVIGGLWPNRVFLRRGARWDGIVPHYPGDGVLPGESVPEEQVTELLEHYRSLTDDPGEILLPLPPGASDEYTAICRDLGATWLYTTEGGRGLTDLRRVIARGPPTG